MKQQSTKIKFKKSRASFESNSDKGDLLLMILVKLQKTQK